MVERKRKPDAVTQRERGYVRKGLQLDGGGAGFRQNDEGIFEIFKTNAEGEPTDEIIATLKPYAFKKLAGTLKEKYNLDRKAE